MNFYPSGMRQNVNVNLFRKPFHSYSVNNEEKNRIDGSENKNQEVYVSVNG